MPKLIYLYHYRAMIDALKALSEFEETGSREGFKQWMEKYEGKDYKEDREAP